MANTDDRFHLDPGDHQARVQAHRRARLSWLTAKDGWLSLVGKHPLHEGDNTAGSDRGCEVPLPEATAPAQLGVFSLRDGAVTFLPAREVAVTLHSAGSARAALLAGPTQLTSDLHGAPDKLVLGTVSCEVMQRANGCWIRVRDSEHDALRSFSGLAYYPVRLDRRVVAQLEPYDVPKPIELVYEDGNRECYFSPGAAVFELDGQRCQVDPVLDDHDQRLFLLFADQTNRDQTYGAGRFLYAALPEDGRVVFDFNLAFNPPCAFTPHALCPLPPAQNHLALRIEAGERRPLATHDGPHTP